MIFPKKSNEMLRLCQKGPVLSTLSLLGLTCLQKGGVALIKGFASSLGKTEGSRGNVDFWFEPVHSFVEVGVSEETLLGMKDFVNFGCIFSY